jgi:hypothetical protein
MVYFPTKNPNLGKFWKVLQWTMMVFLGPFCLFYGQMVYLLSGQLVCTFYAHLIYFSRFGMLYREKSGNPAWDVNRVARRFNSIPKNSNFLFILECLGVENLGVCYAICHVL